MPKNTWWTKKVLNKNKIWEGYAKLHWNAKTKGKIVYPNIHAFVSVFLFTCHQGYIIIPSIHVIFSRTLKAAHQAPLSMEFSRQEYWVGSHSLLRSISLTQGLNPDLLNCRHILYHLRHQGSPFTTVNNTHFPYLFSIYTLWKHSTGQALLYLVTRCVK